MKLKQLEPRVDSRKAPRVSLATSGVITFNARALEECGVEPEAIKGLSVFRDEDAPAGDKCLYLKFNNEKGPKDYAVTLNKRTEDGKVTSAQAGIKGTILNVLPALPTDPKLLVATALKSHGVDYIKIDLAQMEGESK